MGTYTHLITTRPVLEEVIQDLGLNTTVDDLREQVRVSSGSSSMLVQVSVEDTSPEYAAAKANALVMVLIEQSRPLLQHDQIARRSSVQMVEAAQPNPNPVRPRTLLIIVLSGMLGATGTSSAVLAYSYFREQKVHSIEQVEAILGILNVSLIPYKPSAFAKGPLVTLTHTYAPMIESYYMLYARLTTTSLHSVRTLAVMSRRAGEGKSTIAANLGVVLAQSSKQVIVVDANLRAPTLHTVFGVSNSHGLAAALAPSNYEIPVARYLLPTEVEGLHVLPAGIARNMPPDTLGSSQMTQLCRELTTLADIVLFDTPPLTNTADAVLVSAICDGVLLVMQAETTSIDMAQQTQKYLEGFGIQPWGIVLNAVHLREVSFPLNNIYRPASAPTQRKHQHWTEQPVSSTTSHIGMRPDHENTPISSEHHAHL
jgi:capsular exopolysaccharide synthesis family protein